ncbi:oleate hydratase [uncultured Clostridium sp.]|uniref:oleate hydratase n=1 Tax=uncultured Clostridium sp. TaxID=59620 RepID=UPI0025F8A982|nr:oleate hydratase [uncultured Clostridium sp.]
MKNKDYNEYRRFIQMEKLKRIIGVGAITVAAGLSAKYILSRKREDDFITYKKVFNSDNDSNVYFIGGGLASLAGAAYLIRDCNFKGENIHIIEGLKVLGGSNDGGGSAENGFICRGGRMLNEETYENFWELFSSIPSLEYPNKSVTEEILNFDHHHPTHAKARLVDKYGDIIDVSSMGFNNRDRLELLRLMMTPEENLDEMTIEEWFNEHFFTTNFWYMWQTTFAFQKYSSLFEFKRYINRMIFEFSRIETLEGVTRTTYNQYESVILPLKKYLEGFGVDFIVNTKVTDLEFKEGPGIAVTAIHMEEGKSKEEDKAEYTIDNIVSENSIDDPEENIDNLDDINADSVYVSEEERMMDSNNEINRELNDEAEEKSTVITEDNKTDHSSQIVSDVMKSLNITASDKADEKTSAKEKILYLKDNDKCIMINGCMTDNATLGDYYTAPKFDDSKPMSSELWEKISSKKPGLGSPKPFFDYPEESNWESFTVTCKGNKLLKYIEKFSMNIPGSGALMTFRDSSWLMSIVVAAQPHFKNQPMDTTIFWGYGLYTAAIGDYIKKPMRECTGEEILMELLYHLHLIDKKEEILKDIINVIPCMMPYINAQFQARKMSDRPPVVPKGSTNFAMISQFVEIPEDMVFTEEYSVRAARIAVYTLFNVCNKEICPVTQYNKDPKILIKALIKSFE